MENRDVLDRSSRFLVVVIIVVRIKVLQNKDNSFAYLNKESQESCQFLVHIYVHNKRVRKIIEEEERHLIINFVHASLH